MTNTKNHCSQCGFEIKIVSRKATVVYNCLECGYRIPTDTKICKKHGAADYKILEFPEGKMVYKCSNCGFKEPKTGIKKREDALFKKLNFARSIKDLVFEVGKGRF